MTKSLGRVSRGARCVGSALVMLGLAAGLGGCGMSSLTSGLGGGVFGSSKQAASVDAITEEQLLSAAKADEAATGSTSVGAVAHGCPKFVPWPRENHVTIYEQGRVGDALAVMHRGEITKTARECQIEPGKVTVKYGFSGRVLMGPKGKGGAVTLPVTVTVTDAKRAKIAVDMAKVDTAVSIDKPIGYFSAVRTVTFAIPEGSRPGDFEVFVGFDRNTPGAG